MIGQVVVKAMQGIGDQVYSRPFVKKLADKRPGSVYVETGLPELYEDMNVRFIDPGEPKYRTQRQNYVKTQVKFEELSPGLITVIDYSYKRFELKQHGIVSHIEHCFQDHLHHSREIFPELKFTLPNWNTVFVDTFLGGFSKLAIVRPVTTRREWYCETRSPEPNYIAWCARMLLDAGYDVISIADCLEDEEWIEGKLPNGVYPLHHGELGLINTLSLIRKAAIVVSGPCFVTPVAISAGVPLFTIFGGRGEYDNPHNLFDMRMDLKKIGWAIPDNFCRCNRQIHSCDKRITNLDDKFMSFMRQIQ